jgi:hypothetical protein
MEPYQKHQVLARDAKRPTPGLYFGPYPYDEQDQTKISAEQVRQTGALIGFMLLLMIGGWHAWLIADGSFDRIEFWEGNILFHSNERARVADTNSLMDQFDCPCDLL